MTRVVVLLFSTVAFAATANAQCFERSALGHLMAGPCAENLVRSVRGQVTNAMVYSGLYDSYGYGGLGYGLYPYGNSRSALVGALAGAVTGALTGTLAGRAASRRYDREYVPSPDGRGRAYYAPSAPQEREVRWPEPKRQKPLDCRKPAGKRGKNEAACAAAEAEFDAQNEAIKHQACLDRLAASTWFIRNGSAIYTAFPTVNSQPLTICGEPVVLRPHQTNNIFPPGDKDQVSGKMYGAVDNNWTGKRVELPARVRAVNRPVAGSNGFVLLAPCEPDKPCLAGEGN